MKKLWEKFIGSEKSIIEIKSKPTLLCREVVLPNNYKPFTQWTDDDRNSLNEEFKKIGTK